jgi:hypothetical protein
MPLLAIVAALLCAITGVFAQQPAGTTYNIIGTITVFPVPGAPVAPVTGADLPTFALNNEATTATGAHALSWGTIFIQGAVPSGQTVAATVNDALVATQLDCKARWADNSCKHGIISVIAPSVPASTGYKVTLALTSPSGTPVDLATLPGSGYTLSTALQIQALQGTTDGPLYNINWMTELTAALSGETCSYWRQGPVVSECRINKDLEGSLHLQADIARYSDGSVQVDMIALNDYYNPSSGVGHRRYYYTVTQNGSHVVDYSSGVGVAQSLYTTRHDRFWSNGKPALVVQYDTQSLIDAGFVLNFDKSFDPNTLSGYSESTLATQMADTSRWGGAFPYAYLDPDFTAGGGSPPEIGYYTGPQFTLMMAWKKVRYDYVLGQADASGSVPWHQFDKTLGRFANVLDHPTAWYDTRDKSVFTNWGCEQASSGYMPTTAPSASGTNVLHFGAGKLPGSATSSAAQLYIGQDSIAGPGIPVAQAGPGLPTVTAINAATGDITISQNLTSTAPSGSQFIFSCRWRPNGLHPPNLTTLPYMVTGERYYLDELLAEANWVEVVSWPLPRNGNSGPATQHSDILLNWATNVRQQAWSYRQINEAIFLGPDDSYYSWYKTNLPIIALDNVDYANTAIANIKTTVGNVVYGWVGGGNGWGYANQVPADGTCTPDAYNAPQSYSTPPWQHAYMAASVGHAIKHKINVTENTLLLQNLGNFLTQMAQAHPGWDRRNAGAYYMSVCNYDTNVFAKDWATISTNMVGHSPCAGNDCNFASTGFVGANYFWLSAESNAMISHVLGSTPPGPAGLDGYIYLRDTLLAAGNWDVNVEPQWSYRP